MTRRRSLTGPPRDFVAGEWPDGDPVSDAPRALEHARTVAIRLADALVGRSVTDVADAADLARSTIYDLLGGRTWPDLISLGKLEDALGIELLPPLRDADRVR